MSSFVAAWVGPTLLGSTVLASAATGAIIGAGVGGVSAAIGGEDILDGAIRGGLTGAVGGAVGGAFGGAGAGNTAAGYTLTGDPIADMGMLTDIGYSGSAAEQLINGPGAGTYVAGIGQGAGASSGGPLSGAQERMPAVNLPAVNSGPGGLGQVASTGLGMLGSYLQGDQAKDAATTSALAQVDAAKIAADAAKFRPVGVTSRFGASQFGYDAQGNLTSAGYTLPPEIRAQQDRLMGISNQALDQYQGAFAATAPMGQASQQAMRIGQDQMNAGQGMMTRAEQWNPDINEVRAQNAGLGTGAARSMALGNQYLANDPTYTQAASNAQYQKSIADTARYGTAATNMANLGDQYLGTSPQAQAQKYMSEQQALLAGGRATDYAAMQQQLQNTGRAGLSMGGGGGMTSANPEMQAYYNAQRQQDLGLAAQATQGGMDYARFGEGMLSSSAAMQNRQFANQSAMMTPFNQQQQNEMNLAKYGAGMVGTGGNLMSLMYGNQAAAYDPYKTALGLGQQQANYGIGAMGAGSDLLKSMYSTQTAAYDPYQTAMGGATMLEGLGQNAMDMGINIGAKGTASSAQAGQLIQQGMLGAAKTMQPANEYSPWGGLLTGAGQALQQYGQPTQQPRFDPFTGRAL